MKWIRRHKTLAVAGIAALLVLAMAVASLFASGRVSPASDLLGGLMRPLQTLMNRLAGGVGGFWGYVYEYEGLLDEVGELRLRLARAEAEIRRLEKAGEENERLLELLGIHQKRPDFQFVPADIIQRDMSNWARIFTLDKGAADGVKVGDCVISAEGYMVGRVSAAGRTWCEVVTVIDTDMAAGAIVDRTSLTAAARGSFEMMQKDRLSLIHLRPDVDLMIGDLVLTSGIGGVLPGDVPIGRVADVRQERDGMSAVAELTPLADLDRLRVCYIVIGFDGASGEEEGGEMP
ncbi:MAG: rod shape-determining protein MreC [Oscillospiraceae bacterium]|nr:rod shape-determining protein MreC [Oscillospiraceae bacterium]